MKILRNITLLCLTTFLLASCQKDSYYRDSGTHDPNFKGNMMQYLESRPDLFDTLVQVINIAGMQDIFKNQDITFFAPADSSFKATLELLNTELLQDGRDSLTRLDQINPNVWKSELAMYIFRGKKMLNDYPQVDLDAVPVFPGQAYDSYDGKTMNIGVIYNDAGGIQYSGYRQLVISYIPSSAAPIDGWVNAWVASSNILPTNGVVHVLRFQDHFFGFDPIDFVQHAIDEGIAQP